MLHEAVIAQVYRWSTQVSEKGFTFKQACDTPTEKKKYYNKNVSFREVRVRKEWRDALQE